MARETIPIKLRNIETRSLKSMLTRGAAPARTLCRARILNLLNRGRRPAEVAATLEVSAQTVYNVKRRYLAGGLQSSLYDGPRAGRPVEIDGRQRAKITALACSTPPQGHARWTLRLLADKVVELGYCESLSHTKVRQILKKTLCSRTSRSSGV